MARPVFTEEQVQVTRQRLCAIALALYRAEGYEAVTLREVGTVAGISHSALYRYFRSKEDLFLHVRAEVYRQLGEHFRKRDPRDADPLSRLRCIVIALAEFGRQSPEDYRLIFSMRQAPTDPASPLAIARAKVLAEVVAVCQLAIDAGQISGDAVTHAHLAWVSVHGLLSLHVSNQLENGRSLDDLLTTIVDRLFSGAAAAGRVRERLATSRPARRRASRS